jgi:hypothetical protein
VRGLPGAVQIVDRFHDKQQLSDVGKGRRATCVVTLLGDRLAAPLTCRFILSILQSG